LDDLKLISQVSALLQVGFAGFVAVFLLVKFYKVLDDVSKQLALVFQMISELRSDLKEERENGK